MSFLSNCLKYSIVASAIVATSPYQALAQSDSAYFRAAQGKWIGAGKIVAGPYKNTRFTCKFDGSSIKGPGLTLSGKCRVGLFSQQISATIKKRGGSYRGKFLDGAAGKGLDIVSGRLRGKRLVVGIKRKQLNGTMVANMNKRNRLNITISVRVNKKLVPFIGLTLDRSGGAQRTSLLSD